MYSSLTKLKVSKWMEASEYLVDRAARAGTTPVLGSMWGCLVHCGDRWVQDRAELLTLPLPAASASAAPTSRIPYRSPLEIEAWGLGWRLHVFS